MLAFDDPAKKNVEKNIKKKSSKNFSECGEVVQFKNFEVLNPTGQNRSKSGFRTKQIYSHFNSCNDSTSLSSYPLTLSQLETSKIELLKKLCQLQKNTHQTGLPGP